MKRWVIAMAAIVAFTSVAQADVLQDRLHSYQSQGAGSFDAKRGEKMWHEKHISAKDGKNRDCTTCHGKDLTQRGKHVRTGKVIDPLSPSVNKERLTDAKKIEKWFKRNCKWVLGRECTPQEKGDFLSYIATQ